MSTSTQLVKRGNSSVAKELPKRGKGNQPKQFMFTSHDGKYPRITPRLDSDLWTYRYFRSKLSNRHTKDDTHNIILDSPRLTRIMSTDPRKHS